jgi:putative methanogenesis marker protein 8
MKAGRRIPVGEHEFYCCGARVLIKDGAIEVLTEPRISYCPLHEAMYGTKTLDREAVKRTAEIKIKDLGFCCEDRVFDESSVVPYGSSEIISVCMKKRLLDCAVTVCDGAGTVIADRADLVQAIGARLTGIVRTSRIRSTIDFVKASGGVVLDEASARVDQAEGVSRAIELGHKRVAVTIAGFNSEAIERLRAWVKDKAVSVAIFSVCNTCAEGKDVERIMNGADVVCASASRLIRERVGPKAVLQLGLTIPVFALTRFGKELLLSYLMEFSESIVAFRTSSMPYLVEGRGPR